MATYTEAAIKILRDANEPLHYKEITRRAQKAGLIGNSKTPENTMNSAIVTNMSKHGNKSAFNKAGKGIYVLNPNFSSIINVASDTSRSDESNLSIQPLFTTFIKGYSINQIPTPEGEYVYGSINKRTKFIFCPKQKTLFNSAVKKCVKHEKFPALYALFDVNKNNVYIGQTDAGKQRINNHWSSQRLSFTHIAVIFDEVIDSEKMRKKLEFELSKLFDRHLTVTNQYIDAPIGPDDEHTYLEVHERTERISTILCFLIGDLPKPEPEPYFQDWIWPTTLNSYKIMRANGFWASKAPLRKISSRVRPGARVVFYVPERRIFAGVYQFVGSWHESTNITWPDELESNKIIHTSQIKLQLKHDGIATLDSVGELEIFKNKSNRGLALRSSNGYPANNGKPIPASDMKAIIEHMRPGSL